MHRRRRSRVLAAGGHYYFDTQNRLFWTCDTPELITRKFEDIVLKYKLGGVMTVKFRRRQCGLESCNADG
jgi:GH18 family chitinase